MGIFEVAGDEGAESFLPSCVPELKAVVFAAVGDIFGEEIDSNGGLG